MTTEIMSYGVRTIDAVADEYPFIPGFVGEVSEFDGSRADASPWLDQLPVIQEFRRTVLLT